MTYGGRNHTTLLSTFAVALALAVCDPPISAEGQREPIGYVVDSTGDWLQDGVKFLHENGDPVYAGAVITPDPAYEEARTRGAAIVIVLFNGTRLERSFDKPMDFAKSIELPKSLAEASSPVGRLLRAMGGLFSGHTEKYVITTVRSADQWPLNDAVATLDRGGIDLAPIFKVAPAGRYNVHFSPVDQLRTGQLPLPGPISLDWKPGGEHRVAVPELRPGLWRISLLQIEDQRPLGVDAWVLICIPGNYEETVRSLNQVVAITDKWGRNISPDEKRSFLRTALDAIAQRSEQ